MPPALSWSVFGTFLAAFTIAYFVLDLPWWMPVLYAGLSVITIAAYGVDKGAARRGRRRVSEQSLVMLGLFGGWPGALIAQQLFRHKTRKRSFRRAFWCSVVINVAALIGLIGFAKLSGIALDIPDGMLSLDLV
nr:DUF1294 domain-containing protein [Microbacterium marinum]